MNDPVIKYCIIYLYYHPIYYLISCCSIPSLYLPVSLYLTLSLSHTLTLSLSLSLSLSSLTLYLSTSRCGSYLRYRRSHPHKQRRGTKEKTPGKSKNRHPVRSGRLSVQHIRYRR